MSPLGRAVALGSRPAGDLGAANRPAPRRRGRALGVAQPGGAARATEVEQLPEDCGAVCVEGTGQDSQARDRDVVAVQAERAADGPLDAA